MGSYIDRDELLELYKNTDDLDISDYDVKVAVIRQNILDMPTIDLVRCGECIHRHEHEWYNTCDKHIGHGFEDDYFCKYGERRVEWK